MRIANNLILVIGATGNIGRHVVTQLLDAGASVRALTRNPALARLPNTVEVVRGDLGDPATLDVHMEGITAVFLVWPFGTAEAVSPVLDLVKRHTRRIVYLSSLGVRDHLTQQPDLVNQFHADIEQAVRQANLDWTFLRPSGFATNTLRWAPLIRTTGVVREPYGAAARSLIHERDIAAVAVRALLDSHHIGATHLLTGPQVLTQVEQLHIIGQVIGREVHWEEIRPTIARQEMITAWGDESLVDSVLAAWASMVTHPEPVTSTVEEITGRPARAFRAWAIEHASDF